MAEVKDQVEDDIDPLALEAYAEQDAEGEDPIKKKIEESQQETEEPESEPQEEPEEEAEPTEEEEEKPEEEPEKPEEAEEEPEKSEDEVIRQIAIDESLTVEEAKSQHEARKNILEKYKNDPNQMAKALQSTQSAYDKTRTELEKIKSQPDVEDIEQTIANDEAKIPAYVQSKQDELIEQYKAKYPRKTENMSDELILEEVTEVVRQNYRRHAEKKIGEIKDQATRRRDELLTGLNEKDREFLPEVKAILNDTPDTQVLHKSFDIMDLVYHARGQKYTPEYIEQIKKEAAAKGQEEAKIIGEKVPESKGSAPIKKVGSTSLTEKQKERAQEMFPDKSLEVAIADYKDVFAADLKKDPKYLG